MAEIENTNSITITLDRSDYIMLCGALRLVILEHHFEHDFDFKNMFKLYDTVKREAVKHDTLRDMKKG
jgi:hypothetical protein